MAKITEILTKFRQFGGFGMLRAGVPPLTRASSGPRSERGDLFLEQERLRDAAKHTTGTTTNGADRASQTLKNVVICSEAVKL